MLQMSGKLTSLTPHQWIFFIFKCVVFSPSALLQKLNIMLLDFRAPLEIDLCTFVLNVAVLLQTDQSHLIKQMTSLLPLRFTTSQHFTEQPQAAEHFGRWRCSEESLPASIGLRRQSGGKQGLLLKPLRWV